ncbi:MAG TPA: hypothetical protein VEX18_00480 [Polyangiaceae bacterium]|nr:hypothetical protein [Polyangiaceae bacterium]
MRRGSWSRPWGLMLTWSGLASAVTTPSAETSVERRYSLEYQAAADCPAAPALAQAIESRTPGATQQGAGDAMVRLRVELREDGTSTLWVDLPEGRSQRDFPPASCADTLASIAVIASMVLETSASERLSAVQSVMDRLAPETSTPEPVLPAAAPETTLGPARPAEETPAQLRGHAHQPAPERAKLRIAIAAGLLLESAVARNAAWGADAGVGAWLEPRRPSVWVPSIRVQALVTLPATVRAEQGDLELRLLAGRLHVCPLRLPVGASLRIVPCLTGDVGVLRARGTGQTLNPLEPTMPWLALGGTLRAQLALGRVVALESWLGLRGLARADTFVFSRPDLVGYQVPHWSLGAGLGLSLALR